MVINAQATGLTADADGFFVAPVRDVSDSGAPNLRYNPISGGKQGRVSYMH